MKPVLLVVAPYYTHISDMLVAGARAAVKAAGYESELLTVPGALEIPAAIAIAAHKNNYAAYVALGCVIRGETTHYEVVANESARGLQQLALTKHLAIGNGILTVENEAQAIARADIAHGNKGSEAAHAALQMLTLRRQFGMETA
jgi:6,7-dimethyl-8-ribityllumazine synthase